MDLAAVCLACNRQCRQAYVQQRWSAFEVGLSHTRHACLGDGEESSGWSGARVGEGTRTCHDIFIHITQALFSLGPDHRPQRQQITPLGYPDFAESNNNNNWPGRHPPSLCTAQFLSAKSHLELSATLAPPRARRFNHTGMFLDESPGSNRAANSSQKWQQFFRRKS